MKKLRLAADESWFHRVFGSEDVRAHLQEESIDLNRIGCGIQPQLTSEGDDK
jgi:hypothetical protein